MLISTPNVTYHHLCIVVNLILYFIPSTGYLMHEGLSWTTIFPTSLFKCSMAYFCKTMPLYHLWPCQQHGEREREIQWFQWINNPMISTFLGNWTNDTMHVMMEMGHLILHDTKEEEEDMRCSNDVDDMEHTYEGCHNLARHVRYICTQWQHTRKRCLNLVRHVRYIAHNGNIHTRVVITWWDMCDMLHTMATYTQGLS